MNKWEIEMEITIEIKCACGSKSMVQIFSAQKEYLCNSCGSELFKAHISTGHVYILSNPSMPNLLKIGYTERDVDERVVELNSTGVPVPFEIEAIFGSPNAYEDEQAIHNILNQHRIANNREFFSIDLKDAVQRIMGHIGVEPSFIKSPDLLMNQEEMEDFWKAEAEKRAETDRQANAEKKRQAEVEAKWKHDFCFTLDDIKQRKLAKEGRFAHIDSDISMIHEKEDEIIQCKNYEEEIVHLQKLRDRYINLTPQKERDSWIELMLLKTKHRSFETKMEEEKYKRLVVNKMLIDHYRENNEVKDRLALCLDRLESLLGMKECDV